MACPAQCLQELENDRKLLLADPNVWMVVAAVTKFLELQDPGNLEQMVVCVPILQSAGLLPADFQPVDKHLVIDILCRRGFDIMDLHLEKNQSLLPMLKRGEWSLIVQLAPMSILANIRREYEQRGVTFHPAVAW